MDVWRYRRALVVAGALLGSVVGTWIVSRGARGDSGEPDGRTFWIEHSGFSRPFVVALDEIAAGGVRERIPAAADLDELRSIVEMRDRLAGGRGVSPVLYEGGGGADPSDARVLTASVIVRLRAGAGAERIADLTGSTIRPVPWTKDLVIADAASPFDALDLSERLRAAPEVVSADPILAHQRFKRLVPNDTFFSNQWHLQNTGQNNGVAGVDVNIVDTWNKYVGRGVVVGIVDDGLEFKHPDLAQAVKKSYGWDWVGGDADPSPDPESDSHGTACAGVAAARGNNGKGVSGAASGATLAGLRLLGPNETDETEAAALAHRNDVIHIKSNSWGPRDSGRVLEAPGPLTQAAIADAIANGRGGKGTIFVWAGGNGGSSMDDANYDGYANSPYTIAIGAVDDTGQQTTYSEPGACLVVCAPSRNESHQGITTTDLRGAYGYNQSNVGVDLPDLDYTSTFGGTSSACPLAAGVVAVILEANPNLGWRDVQEILMRTATVVQPADSDWITNTGGFHFNHRFGAGMINAGEAVKLARSWKNRAAATSVVAKKTGLSVTIPDNNPGGVALSFDLKKSKLRVEHVEITVTIAHASRGDLAITLTSPSGTTSRLAEMHNDQGDNFPGWTFMTVRSWGERSTGTWVLNVADKFSGNSGTITAAQIKVRGVALK